MQKLLIIILLFISKLVATQNLVPNPSFEEYDTCIYQIDYCFFPSYNGLKYWMSPSMGSPDYFNVCDTNDSNLCHVPDNWWGFQTPHTGNAYVGLTPRHISNIDSNFHEYIEVQLTQALLANKKYNITLYLSLSDSSCISIKDIAAYFSDTAICYNSINYELPVSPQISFNDSFHSDKENWMRLSAIYNASGGEQYISIGNFNSVLNTDTLYVGNCATFYNVFFRTAYYFIDDVSVEIIPDTSVIEDDIFIPNIFSPNGDLNNDVLYVRSHNIKTMDFCIYNRWGEKVFEAKDINKGWDGRYNGSACNEGVFVYYLSATLKDDKTIVKKGNVTLIR
jgi:gliding motility-associated-like protein